MTGFGRSVTTTSLGTLTIEIKTVNHRYCQITYRSSPEFSEFEPRVSAWMKELASRGHVNVSAQLVPDSNSETSNIHLNIGLAQAYVQSANVLKQQFDLADGLTIPTLLTLPGVIRVTETASDEEQRWSLLETGIRSAWDSVQRMRDAEGKALQREMTERLGTIRSVTIRIADELPDLVAYYRERLTKRIQDLTRNGHEVDESRIVMEAGLLADRSDVSEELSRLDSHCQQFEAYLTADEAVGRQMDFLLQEMNRETNTIGSKASQGAVVSSCVALKTEIEKLREQAQNIE